MREDHVKKREKEAICKPEKEASGWNQPSQYLGPRQWSLQGCEEVTVYGFSRSLVASIMAALEHYRLSIPDLKIRNSKGSKFQNFEYRHVTSRNLHTWPPVTNGSESTQKTLYTMTFRLRRRVEMKHAWISHFGWVPFPTNLIMKIQIFQNLKISEIQNTSCPEHLDKGCSPCNDILAKVYR
jgi:hypothetical protein